MPKLNKEEVGGDGEGWHVVHFSEFILSLPNIWEPVTEIVVHSFIVLALLLLYKHLQVLF